MEKSTANELANKVRPGHASPEELVRLHKSIFKSASPTHDNDGFVGYPPGFEFQKMMIWEDTPSFYSTDTHAGVCPCPIGRAPAVRFNGSYVSKYVEERQKA